MNSLKSTHEKVTVGNDDDDYYIFTDVIYYNVVYYHNALTHITIGSQTNNTKQTKATFVKEENWNNV